MTTVPKKGKDAASVEAAEKASARTETPPASGRKRAAQARTAGKEGVINEVRLTAGRSYRIDPDSGRVVEFAGRLIDELERGLVQYLQSAKGSRINLADLGRPEELAAVMLATLPGSHPYDEVLGPFYETTGLRNWLEVSRQALNQRVETGAVLGCPLDDGTIVYPAWQFQPNGSSLVGLSDVVKILKSGTNDTWQIALWICAPNSALADMSPRDWLQQGRPLERLLQLAARTAARWAH